MYPLLFCISISNLLSALCSSALSCSCLLRTPAALDSPLFLFIIPRPYLLVYIYQFFCCSAENCLVPFAPFVSPIFIFSFVSATRSGLARDEKYETIASWREHTRRFGKSFSLFTLCTLCIPMRTKCESAAVLSSNTITDKEKTRSLNKKR